MTNRIRMRFVAPLRTKTPPFPLSGDVAFLPMEAIGEDGSYDRDSVRPAAELVDSGYTYFEQGDVVRARVTPCFENGKGALLSSLVGGRGLGTTELFVFKPSAAIDERYLFYVTSSQEFTGLGTGTIYGAHGVRRVDDRFARDYRVWLPPIATQRTIADYLDRETARIDALITAKRRMIELLEEAFIARVELTLSGAASMRMPVRRLLTEPPQYGASESGEIAEHDWPRYIRITDLAPDGTLSSDDVRRLPPDVARPYLLHDKDLLLARSGATVGKAFMYQASMGPCCYAGYLIRFRFDPNKNLPELVELWTRTGHYWGQVREASLQATIENVSAERYKEFQVPVLPTRKQEMALRGIEGHRTRTGSLRLALTKQMNLLRQRRQSLITAAVSGEMETPLAAA